MGGSWFKFDSGPAFSSILGGLIGWDSEGVSGEIFIVEVLSSRALNVASFTILDQRFERFVIRRDAIARLYFFPLSSLFSRPFPAHIIVHDR